MTGETETQEAIFGAARMLRDRDAGEEVSFRLADGRMIVAKLEWDTETRLEDDGDWFGKLEWARPDRNAGYYRRPAGFDGAARKIPTRGEPIWWQPPADLVSDPENLAKLEARMRGYFREDWGYMGVTASYAGDYQSVWAVESDADLDYLASILSEQIAALPEITPEDAAWLQGWKDGMLEALGSIDCCGDVDERVADLYEYVETGVFPERDDDA